MYSCKCGFKAVKQLGKCPSCNSWGGMQEIVEQKKVYTMPKVSKKAKEKKQTNTESKKELDNWFNDRRKEMTGICQCGCGLKTSKDDDTYFKFSIAHILPKSKFDSVKTHKDNWIELRHWQGDGCITHSNFDYRSSEDWKLLACWGEIKQKFIEMHQFIKQEEKRFMPVVLKSLDQYLDKFVFPIDLDNYKNEIDKY